MEPSYKISFRKTPVGPLNLPSNFTNKAFLVLHTRFMCSNCNTMKKWKCNSIALIPTEFLLASDPFSDLQKLQSLQLSEWPEANLRSFSYPFIGEIVFLDHHLYGISGHKRGSFYSSHSFEGDKRPGFRFTFAGMHSMLHAFFVVKDLHCSLSHALLFQLPQIEHRCTCLKIFIAVDHISSHKLWNIDCKSKWNFRLHLVLHETLALI